MSPRKWAGSDRLKVNRAVRFVGGGMGSDTRRAILLAASAVAQNLDGLGHEFEAQPIGLDADEADGAGRIEFHDDTAGAADEEHAGVRSAMGTAADKGVHGVETMDQASLAEEIERAIDGRRSGLDAAVAQGIDQVIGLDRLMIPPDQFQYLTPDRGQAQPLLTTGAFGFGQCVPHTVPVVVSGARRLRV